MAYGGFFYYNFLKIRGLKNLLKFWLRTGSTVTLQFVPE
ncbi:hypothetical protein MARI151_10690 [Maribacter litoralis]|uniref:Uncharacterized protein n=1 Tax=Maribacter litoralis TaxID=2059726 RepID=A0A653NG97_9FLAO|nr:hypothetical protein MARI151_10690 [Maribacter litoralis]